MRGTTTWAAPVALAWLVLAGIAAPAALGAFPGANGRIAFQTAGGLGTLNAVGGDRQPLVGGSGTFAAPTWSPDGSRVAFSSNSDAGATFELYTTGAQGGAVTRLTTNTAEDDAPAWSPDGRRLVFDSDRDGGPSQLYVMNADGTGVARLTFGITEDRTPSWSPDGTRIAFARGSDIWTITPEGGLATPLTTGPGDKTNPDWAPDGTRIAFQRDDSIVVMGANGTGQTPLPLPAGAARPAWAPDGSRILFDLGEQLFSANPDGSGVTPLTTAGTSALIARAPSWQPVPTAAPPPPPPTVDPPSAPSKRAIKRRLRASLTTSRRPAYSKFTSMKVQPVRAGDLLRLTCKGQGCKRKRVTMRIRKNRRSLSLLGHLRGAKLRRGAVVQLRVTRTGAIGRVTTWRIKAPKRPVTSRACLAPGTTKPIRCPA